VRRRLILVLTILALSLAVVTPAFAHPAVPEQSLKDRPLAAANGIHRAVGNVIDAPGIAYHVFQMRFNPHD
jgi:hypothetical protein